MVEEQQTRESGAAEVCCNEWRDRRCLLQCQIPLALARKSDLVMTLLRSAALRIECARVCGGKIQLDLE